MMTLREFAALGTPHTVAEGDHYGLDEGMHILTYPGGTYIECDPLGVYVLPLVNVVRVDVDLRPLVAALYFFAKDEELLCD